MNCKNCQNELSDNAKFCGKCGQKVEAVIENTSPTKKDGKKSWLGGAVGIIVFILAFVVVRYLTQEAISPSSNNISRADLINQAVSEVKSQMTIPSKIDEITTLTNVTAETGAIRYHYTLTGADTSNLSNSYLKNYLGQSICSNSDTKNLLNQDINMEYAYIISETGQNYLVTFNKADCQ